MFAMDRPACSKHKSRQYLVGVFDYYFFKCVVSCTVYSCVTSAQLAFYCACLFSQCSFPRYSQSLKLSSLALFQMFDAKLGLPDMVNICVDVAQGCKYLEDMHFVHR